MKVLVLGAGGPAGVNTIRALRRAKHYVVATEGNDLHLDWPGVATIHVPWHTTERINEICAEYLIDVVLAQPDPLVSWLANRRMSLNAASFLPSAPVVERCQDKFQSSYRWYGAGLRQFAPFKLEEPWPDSLHLARDVLGLPLWLRATRGAGAKGAILVKSLDQAYHWIRFWASRGSDMEWIAEEYLPGRDLAWSSLWYKGQLITSFARERVEYLYPHLTPEGLTGTPTVATVIHDDDVNRTARDAVFACDSQPHGIYSVDLREDVNGEPRPTEINAGRGFTTFGLWSMYSHNFLDAAVKLATHSLNEKLPRYDALPEGLTLSRHVDVEFRFSPAKTRALTLCA